MAALALSLLSAAPTSATASADHARLDGRARAVAALDAVRAAFAGKAASRAPRPDPTLLLRDLRLARSDLSRSQRASADTYLARPSLGSACSGTVAVAGQFCVHYTSPGRLAGANAATPEQAQLTADTLANVWSAEVGSLGFRPPPADADGTFDVYLQDVGAQGYYGYCAPDQEEPHSTSYCVLDNDFDPAQFGGAPALNSLQVTAAHEFFHAIQFGYDTGEDIWLMEGSAVWAEDQVYPAINDYLQYLPFSAIPRPTVPVDYKGVTSSDLFFRYGAVLFWKFLSERFGDPGIIRRVWEYAEGSAYSLQAVTAALAERGWTFSRAFAAFGAWNTEPTGSYGDRALFPAPVWWQVAPLGKHQRRISSRAATLDHLTNAAMLIQPTGRLPRKTRAKIIVNGPDLAHMPAATVQVRRRDGSARILDVPLDAHGDGSIRIVFDPRRVASAVVTPSNASTRMATCWTDTTDRFACGGQSADDGQVYAVRAKLLRRK